MSSKVKCSPLSWQAPIEITICDNHFVVFGLALHYDLSVGPDNSRASYEIVLSVVQPTPCCADRKARISVRMCLHNQLVMEDCLSTRFLGIRLDRRAPHMRRKSRCIESCENYLDALQTKASPRLGPAPIVADQHAKYRLALRRRAFCQVWNAKRLKAQVSWLEISLL